jgi:UDP-N-acetyl-D-mannosaminuronate dehydrogenase
MNAAMPEHAVNLLVSAYGDIRDARVVVLGASYRAGVKETAFSGVYPIVEHLERRGAVATVHDPLYSDAELSSLRLTPHRLGTEVDAAILHTAHGDYLELDNASLPGARIIVDGRNCLPAIPDIKKVTIGVSQSSALTESRITMSAATMDK